MTKIVISDRVEEKKCMYYIQSNVAEIIRSADCSINIVESCDRVNLNIDVPECYYSMIHQEIMDKVAEVIVVKYKYDFFRKNIIISGLNKEEMEILFSALISADLEDDKKYVVGKLGKLNNIAIDGCFNFYLKPLKKKWQDIVGLMPTTFINSQLCDFITYLLEGKKSRVYVDNGKVYDSHFRRLVRTDLLEGDNIKLLREIILSNGREIELNGNISELDEFYLKEYYKDKIFFSSSYF